MKKLALDLDALRVDSFATDEAEAARGTVRGHDDTIETENCTTKTTCITERFCVTRQTGICCGYEEA